MVSSVSASKITPISRGPGGHGGGGVKLRAGEPALSDGHGEEVLSLLS
jgi:hypothetical protein